MIIIELADLHSRNNNFNSKKLYLPNKIRVSVRHTQTIIKCELTIENKEGRILDLLFRTEARLSTLLDPCSFQQLRNHTAYRELSTFNATRRIQREKLKKLCEMKTNLSDHSPPPIHFAPPVINYSSTKLSDNEMRLLSFEKKFVLPPIVKKKTLRATLLTDVAAGISNDQRRNTKKLPILSTP